MRTTGFFAIDRHAWAHVCDLGLNQAIAYLIQARGTGGDNRTTAWSVKAIEDRTAISRPRAKSALHSLEESGALTVLVRGTKPRYWLTPAVDIPGSAVHLSPEDHAMIKEAIHCESITLKGSIRSQASDRRRADRLVTLGHLERADDVFWVSETGGETKPAWIWLPNELIDGLRGETAPVELLRQSSNIDAVRLLGNLYFEHDLRDDAGIPWREGEGIYRLYKREEVNQRGEYVIWGFPSCVDTASGRLLGAKEHWRVHNTWDGFFEAVTVLEDAGLLQFVAHLVNSHGPQGEVLHPLPVGRQGEAIEQRISTEAARAAKAMIPSYVQPESYWIMVPVRRHLREVQLCGIGRLRYRPQTEATEAWLRKNAEWHKWVEAYARIADERVGIPTEERAFAISR